MITGKKTKREKIMQAVYDWLVEQGTPGRIASSIIYLMPLRGLKQMCEDENIKY